MQEIFATISILYLILVITFQVSGDIKVHINRYCKLKCANPLTKHTVCEYKCALAPHCESFKLYAMTTNDRQYITNVHNVLRNVVASGEDTRGGNGAAKNMRVLTYDPEIEVSTACWARRCLHSHDKCRHHPKYTTAGQNLYMLSSAMAINGFDVNIFNVSVYDWYDEIDDMDKNIIQKFNTNSGKMIEHFTQVVWAETAFLGCSRVTWYLPNEANLKYRYHLICNYSPAGNVKDLPVYEFGKGCLGKAKPDRDYPALCGIPKKPFTRKSDSTSKVYKMNYTLLSITFFIVILNSYYGILLLYNDK